MSNLSDSLDGIGITNALGVSVFGGVAGIFADIAGTIDLVNLLSKNDDIKNQLSAIQTALRQGFDRLNANDKATRILEREVRLNEAYSLSDSVLGTLQADVEANLDWAARSDRIEKCIQAIDQLDFDGQWMTLYDDEIYYADWWTGGRLRPTVTRLGSLVFTDRYTLPAYMRAVYAFVLVIRAFDPQYREHFRDELQKFTARLVDVHDRSATGIKLMPFADWRTATCQWEGGDGGTPFLAFEQQDTQFRQDTPWLGAVAFGQAPSNPDTLQPLGAVHIYSGTRALGQFPPIPNLGHNVHPTPDPSVLYARLRPKITVAAHAHRKTLYTKVGLSDLREFIDALKRILGDSELGPDPGRSWSLREVAYLLDDLGQEQMVFASTDDGGDVVAQRDSRWWENYKLTGRLSARDVVGRLTGLSHSPSKPPTSVALSLRNALDRSVLAGPVNDPSKWW